MLNSLKSCANCGYGRHVLDIDCPELCRNARTDPKLVSELASAVGYWPQFVLGASVANMLDLASMGLIGQKAGFANDLQTQLKSVSAKPTEAGECNSLIARDRWIDPRSHFVCPVLNRC